MAVTLQDYIAAQDKNIAAGGKFDENTSMGIGHAIARTGHEWGKLKPEQKTPEKAAELALQSVENEKPYLDIAGTKKLAVAYTKDLIERSYKKDAAEGKPKGANLTAYLDDTAKAVSKVNDFDGLEVAITSQDKLGMFARMSEINKFPGIKKEISDSAKKHIGTEGTSEEDLLATLKKNPNHEFDAAALDDPKPEAKNQGWMGIIGALLEGIATGNFSKLIDALGFGPAKAKEQLPVEPAKEGAAVPMRNNNVQAATVAAPQASLQAPLTTVIGGALGMPSFLSSGVVNSWDAVHSFVANMPKETSAPAAGELPKGLVPSQTTPGNAVRNTDVATTR